MRHVGLIEAHHHAGLRRRPGRVDNDHRARGVRCAVQRHRSEQGAADAAASPAAHDQHPGPLGPPHQFMGGSAGGDGDLHRDLGGAGHNGHLRNLHRMGDECLRAGLGVRPEGVDVLGPLERVVPGVVGRERADHLEPGAGPGGRGQGPHQRAERTGGAVHPHDDAGSTRSLGRGFSIARRTGRRLAGHRIHPALFSRFVCPSCLVRSALPGTPAVGLRGLQARACSTAPDCSMSAKLPEVS